MSMKIGDNNATSGMSREIFVEIKNQLGEGLSDDILNTVSPNWRKLAYAIAVGVVNHLINNMEVIDVETSGNVTTTVTGTVDGTAVGTVVGTAVDSTVTGTVTGTGDGTVISTQTNSGKVK